MKDTTFAFGGMVGDREDGAPVDYARYGGKIRDRLAETDVMLALVVDKDDEGRSFDPYNSAGA